MEQHPIPQEISSYEFRLVGDMTLKQFFQVGGGALLSFLIYSTGLPAMIKWPLILTSFGLGAAMAFVPFQERPLERWIFAFFRSVYMPTIFKWNKSAAKPKFYQDEAIAPAHHVIAPQGEEALEEYLSTTPGDKNPLFSKLEDAEKTFLVKMSTLFGPGSPTSGGVSVSVPDNPITTVKPMPVTEDPVIHSAPVAIEHTKLPVYESTPASQPASNAQTTTLNPVVTSAGSQATQTAQFSPDAAPPYPPTTPNTIVGQVMDQDSKIVEGAIMEIRDSYGTPVRALKSNTLGHFMIVTPLQNGKYEVIIEKDGFDFEPLSFEVNGEIVPPIAIRGKREPKIILTENPAGPLPASV